MTVADDSTDNVEITVNDSIVDIAGNPLITDVTATHDTQEVDTVNPTVGITSSQDGLVAYDDANIVTYTLTFAEAVQSVTAADIDVTGAALDANGDAIYSVAHTADSASATVTVTVADDSTDNVEITVNDSIVDIAGNPLITDVTATHDTQEVDTVNPTVGITSSQDGLVAYDDANIVTYTLTFAEAVQSVTAADIDVTGAALDANGDAIYSVAHTADSASATVTVTVADGNTDNVEITVNDSIVDIAGNPLITATHDTQQVDTLNPTSGTIDIVVSDSAQTEGEAGTHCLLLPQGMLIPARSMLRCVAVSTGLCLILRQHTLVLLIQRLAQRR